MLIESYALLGDRLTCALVGLNGSIDWLCLPRFDSPACFAALLGDDSNGRWLIAPRSEARTTRRYRGDTLILETLFETDTGTAALIDFLVPGSDHVVLVRIVEGRTGHVDMHTEMAMRFDYGVTVPWVTRLDEHEGFCAIAGPEMVVLRTTVKQHGKDMRSVADFRVRGGTHRFVRAVAWPLASADAGRDRSGRGARPAPRPIGKSLAAVSSTMGRTGMRWCARC